MFAEESANINQELLETLKKRRESALLINHSSVNLKWLEERPFVCSGLYLPSIPSELETSSYQGFRSWLGQIARNINDSTGVNSHIPITSKTNSAIPEEFPQLPFSAVSKLNSEPLVSVIVPSFGRPALLTRCLESIIAQTLDNFEVILVSNSQPPIKDPRIRLVLTGQKIPVAQARNLGIAEARGRYISYLDDDDYYLPNHLELLAKELIDSGQKFAFSVCARQWEVVNPEISAPTTAVAFDLPFMSETSWLDLLSGNKIPTPAVLHTNSEKLKFDEKLECMEDWDLWLKASSESEIRFVPRITSLFSRRPGDSSISTNRKLLFHWYAFPIWAKHLRPDMPTDINRHFKALLNAHSCQIVDALNRAQDLSKLLPSNYQYVASAISYLCQAGFIEPALASELERACNSEALHFDATIIVPLYNGVELTKSLWRSICNNPSRLKLEYIFVDNNSSDETKSWLGSLGDKVNPIYNYQNRNFAGACNQGAKAARSEILIFLNNDTEVTAGWDSALIDPLLKDEQIGVVGNKHIFPGTTRIHHAGIYIDLSKHPKHYLEGADENDPRINFIRECSAVTGGCFAMRKTDFLGLGGFCEEYKNGYEDIDLFISVKKSGKKIIYTPASRIFHHVSQSPGRSNHNQINYQLFMHRCGDLLTPDLTDFLRQNLEKGT